MRDVKQVEKLFVSLDFETEVHEDLDKSSMDSVIENFLKEKAMNPSHRIVIYYAGHGHNTTLENGMSFGHLVPVDAPDPRELSAAEWGFHAFDISRFMDLSTKIEARHALFLFDSCFSGTVFRDAPVSVPDAIKVSAGLPARQFITSGTEDQKVPDYSIFRVQLVDGISKGLSDLNDDGFVTGIELGYFLKDTVTNYTNGKQTPVYGTLLHPLFDRGDIIFAVPE